MARYLIGIDLGTTNSALAYIDPRQPVQAGRPRIHTFAIPQLVAPGEVASRPLLPSFLYLPGAHDLPAGATALPWDPARGYAVGEFARNHGARIPGRLVTSAKSWLCHAGVDRSAPLLPWNAPPDVSRLSPVEASARYLRHLVEAWNHEMAKGRDEDRLEKQAVVLTVPASFDDVARNLTVEAARKAGIDNLTLVEEPQAAFYCWLATEAQAPPPLSPEGRGDKKLKPGDRCLVVDVGGGTTDFSLIQAVEQQGELTFVRLAVGDHLLLGGDNMDLALAKFVETKLPGAGRLDAVQYGMLTQACRLAKETLLSPLSSGEKTPHSPLPSGERGRGEGASFTVTVVGRGRSVVAGTLHAAITPADVHQILFDGFLPQAPRDAEPNKGARTGLHEMGLPYVSDPAITRHLAGFLKQHGVTAPDAILFNGGVFQPVVLRDRIVGQLRQWFDSPGQHYRPLVLTNPSLDLAVAWGAAYYAWLRHTGGKRIGGGIARSYYIGIAANADVSNAERPVLCVVPQHLEEGEEIALAQPELELAIGQPVMFPLYTSTVRGHDQPGDLLTVAPDQLLQLPPLHTILRGGKRAGARQVPVTLAAKSTEVGTLELWCVAKEGGNRWRLEFNVRDIVKDEASRGREPPEDEAKSITAPTDVWPEAQVQAAADLIRQAYGGSELTPQELPKRMEAALDASRHDWPTGLCRRLWDFLLEVEEQRRRSPAHLSRWYNLVGYCLRPGFGDSLDKFRVEQLWKLMHAQPKGDKAPRQPEGGADFWVMWRRVGGGLPSQLQQALADRLRPIMLPSKGKGGIKPGPNELAEMWRAVASLERIDSKQKEALGQVLLKQVRKSPTPTYAFWSLTRLGARQLLYGPLNAIVHHQVVEGWLDALVGFQPGNDSERLGWAFCLAQLARKTGQRALDVDDPHRAAVLTLLRGQEIPGHWARLVEEVVEPEGEEDSRMFGESLPIGLRLVRSP